MKTRLWAAAACVLAATPAMAQIVSDGSLGPRLSVTGPNFVIPSTLGTLRNTNLFYSFQTFNIGNGQSATFQGLPGLTNIVSRITGGEASTILGTVRSAGAGTALYLINPSGIVFGPNALIDVNGSFYASSAHYLRFADGTRFESRLGPDVSITYAAPNGFGFDAGAIAPIYVQGGLLRAREGSSVGVIGGRIALGDLATSTRLQALGGNAIVVAVASPGIVEFDAQGTRLSGFGALADVVLHTGSDINVNEGPAHTGGGTVFVRGHNVFLDRSHVQARTAFANGRSIDIAAAGDLTIQGSDVVAVTTGAGAAGSLRIAGTNIVVSQGALVDTSCDPG